MSGICLLPDFGCGSQNLLVALGSGKALYPIAMPFVESLEEVAHLRALTRLHEATKAAWRHGATPSPIGIAATQFVRIFDGGTMRSC
jgi:hypothetical protein